MRGSGNEVSSGSVSCRPLHVNRAREILLDHLVEFREALKVHRTAWCSEFPNHKFAVVSHPGRSRPNELPVPPGVTRMCNEGSELVNAATSGAVGLANLLAYDVDSRPLTVWLHNVLLLCRQWWPSSEYPNWIGGASHPAQLFVAGALLWGDRSVDPEWIMDGTLKVWQLPWDPTDPLGPPAAAYATTYSVVLDGEISRRLVCGQQITMDDLKDIRASAATAATIALRRAQFNGMLANHLVLSVTGCNTNDLDSTVISEVVRRAKKFPLVADAGNADKRRALLLKARGLSDDQIAQRLGRTPQTIRNWNKKPMIAPE